MLKWLVPQQQRVACLKKGQEGYGLQKFTLVDGLMELCVNGWRGDNGTFRHG